MVQQEKVEAGSSALRRIILVLTVAAVMAAMMATIATPSFAKGGSTNLYTCFDRTSGQAVVIDASQALKQQFQQAGFKCTKQ